MVIVYNKSKWIFFYSYSGRVDLIQSETHAFNKGKMAGKYQFDTHQPE